MKDTTLPFEPREHARTTDPDTSRAAALAVLNASLVQLRVLAIFRQHPLGLTDEQLCVIYAQLFRAGSSVESNASPRKRRSDLTRLRLIVDSGERRQLTSGRQGVVWVVAPEAQ